MCGKHELGFQKFEKIRFVLETHMAYSTGYITLCTEMVITEESRLLTLISHFLSSNLYTFYAASPHDFWTTSCTKENQWVIDNTLVLHAHNNDIKKPTYCKHCDPEEGSTNFNNKIICSHVHELHHRNIKSYLIRGFRISEYLLLVDSHLLF